MRLLIALVAWLISAPVWANGEVCEIQGARDNPEKCLAENCSAADRTRSVIFPDGREISVVGHIHAYRTVFPRLYDHVSQKPPHEENLNRFLEKVNAENPRAAIDAEKDLAFLKSYLQSRPKTEKVFVGVEFVAEGFPNYQQYFVATRVQIQWLENRVRQSTVDKAYKTLLNVYGPQMYLRATEPELFENAYLRGFESMENYDHEARIRKKRDQLFARLRNSLRNNRPLLHYVIDLRHEFDALHESYSSSAHDQKVLGELGADQFIPESKRGAILAWAKMELAVIDARLRRDKTIARRMVDEKRTGILIIGEGHLIPLARLLQEACRDEQSGT